MHIITSPRYGTPANSFVRVTNLDLSTLPAKARQALPENFEVQLFADVNSSSTESYFWDGTQFVDSAFTPVTSAITGNVLFINPAAYDIEFVW